MATDLGLLSLTQHQNQSKPNPSFAAGSWMWNPRQQSAEAQATTQDDDDSWEVRAFEEDTNQAMGTTWPPRSYTCTFCMREFKSAQALGGHMNVHRRDRARLHQPVQSGSNTLHFHGGGNSSTVIFPNEDFMANGSVCLMYTLPNPNSVSINGGTDRPAMSQFQGNNMVPHFPTSIDFSLISRSSINSSHSRSSNTELSASTDYSNYQVNNGSPIEELDLELRLGRNSSRS